MKRNLLITPINIAMQRQVKVGDRLHWQGDRANLPQSGEVTAIVERFYFNIHWDAKDAARTGRAESTFVPCAILTSPRWHFEDEYQAEQKRNLKDMIARTKGER